MIDVKQTFLVGKLDDVTGTIEKEEHPFIRAHLQIDVFYYSGS